MASPAGVSKTITLEEFLRMPEIDEYPYLEYIDGRIQAKVSPQKKHGMLEKRIMIHISTANGCPLGWLIDPGRRAVSVYRPGRRAERLAADGALPGDPVLIGYRLPIAELFGWLKLRRPDSPPQSQAGSSAPGGST